MDRIIFRVPGTPQPWPKKELTRNRAGRPVIYARDKHGDKKRWIEAVKVAGMAAMKRQPSIEAGVPVILSCEFYLPQPKKPQHKYMVVKPDLDNLAYAIANALSGVCYHDDRQIVQMTAVKLYAFGSFEPHALVKIERLEEK